MNYIMRDKFIIVGVSFFDRGVIILYKNVNYKLIFKRYPYFGITLTKEVFPQKYFNNVNKQETVISYKWNGYFIYKKPNCNKELISAERNFVPLRVK